MIVSNLKKIPSSTVSHNKKITKKCILDQDTCFALMQFSQATFPPGEKAPSHMHSDLTEVFFIQSGDGKIQVDEKSIALTAGITVTVEPNEAHEIVNTGTEDLVILYFSIQH